jgi:hypothetical protein
MSRMSPKVRENSGESFSEAEAVRRREAALKRMLSTPHQPHKPIGKKVKRAQRPAASAKR